MALDVYLASPDQPVETAELVAQFEWDGVWEFLSPFWPPTSSTGKCIDLYDDALFRAENLAQLRSAIASAARALALKPKAWQVQIGTSLKPVRKPIIRTVTRQEVTGTLDALDRAIDRAQREGLEIRFVGD